MAVILYYARLFVWLFGFRRKPESATDLHFFAIRILFRQWCERCIVARTGNVSAADLASRMVPVVAAGAPKLRQSLMMWVIRSRYRLWIPYLALLPIASLVVARRTQLQSRYSWSFLEAWRHLLDHPAQLFSPSSTRFPVNAMLCLAAALLDLAEGELPSYRVALKDDFYRMCRQLGVPHPRTYTRQDFPLPSRDYIIKPIFSAEGRGVLTTSDPHEAERWAVNESWIVQDRLRPHAALRKLWKVETLGCFRVNSAWGEGGPEIVGIQLKVPVASTLTDNFNTGNSMMVSVDSAGVLGARGCTLEGREFESHPLTGERFGGVRLPGVPALIETALKIHREVYPGVLFLGFDVALTDQGPQFIESNLYLAGPEMVHDPKSERFIAAALRYFTERAHKLHG
jgi:hypothetical protein